MKVFRRDCSALQAASGRADPEGAAGEAIIPARVIFPSEDLRAK